MKTSSHEALQDALVGVPPIGVPPVGVPPVGVPPIGGTALGARVDEDVLALAGEHFKHLRYDLAQPILHKMVLDGVQRAEVFHMMGAIYHDQGRFKKAIRFFKKALTLQPGFTDASIGLSVLLNDLGRYDQARRVFERAQQVLAEPEEIASEKVQRRMADKHVEVGEMYFQHSWYKDAAVQFKKALALWPGRVSVFSLLARSYFRMQNLTEAADVLAECLLAHPDCVDARVYLGLCYFKQNRVPEAVQEWERVLEREPRHRQALKYLQAAKSARMTK